MPRPSRNIDQILLTSGRTLFPEHGCAGLSLRRLAEHAQVNVGMFHYHFQSKDNFLRVLLQQMYDEMFLQLQAEVAHGGTAIQRVRQSLCLLGRLMREHGAWLGRVWSDAAHQEPVALQFLKNNGSRHVMLLLSLLEQAAQEGAWVPMAPMQRLSFLMGAVVAPMLIAPRAIQLGIAPPQLSEQVHTDVLSDHGIAERVDRALAVLTYSLKELRHGQT